MMDSEDSHISVRKPKDKNEHNFDEPQHANRTSESAGDCLLVGGLPLHLAIHAGFLEKVVDSGKICPCFSAAQQKWADNTEEIWITQALKINFL